MLYVKDKNFISKENTVVTFGKFDGIHNGHRLLIEKAVRIGHEQGIKVVLCTFNMDNWNAKPQKAITTPDERAYIPSVTKFYDFLVATLEQTPEK